MDVGQAREMITDGMDAARRRVGWTRSARALDHEPTTHPDGRTDGRTGDDGDVQQK